MLLRLCFLPILYIYSLPLFADTIWLKNGDIISGTVTLINSNKLLIETKYAGNLTIPTKEVKTFQIVEATIVQNDLYAQKLHIEKIEPSSEANTILLHDVQGNEQTVAITNGLILMKKKPNKMLNEYVFSGYVKGGFFYDRGAKKNEHYMLDSNLIVKYELWRHNSLLNLRRTLKNDSVSTYYYNAQYNLDKFITPQFFWQSSAQYRYDWIESIKSKRSIGTGPGYQFWDDQLSSFSLALLINYQTMIYRDNNSDLRRPLGSMRWNYQRFLNAKTLKLFTNGTIGRSIDDSVELDFSGTIGLSYNITDWFILNSAFSKEVDKTKDGNSKNINYNIGFGITW